MIAISATPPDGRMDIDAWRAARNALDGNRRIALATVLRTTGSAPRRAGARMVVEADGTIFETVGGGSGEHAVLSAARHALGSDRPEIVRFEMKGEGSGGGAMVCGGSMEILVEPLRPERDAAWVRAIVRLREEGGGAWLCRVLGEARAVEPAVGEPRAVEPATSEVPAVTSSVIAVLREDGAPAWVREGSRLPELPSARLDQSIAFLPGPEPGAGSGARSKPGPGPGTDAARGPGSYPGSGDQYVVESIPPVERLVIVGGGHIGLALSRIASVLRFEVTVIDERKEFAIPERFPDAARVLCGDPGELVKSIAAGEHAHFVLVSHRFPSDLEALRVLARREARYIGMIGSRRRVETVFRALRGEGLEPAALERVYAPIGIDIGAQTPEEIAVSIVAEILAVRSGMGRTAGSLSGEGGER